MEGGVVNVQFSGVSTAGYADNTALFAEVACKEGIADVQFRGGTYGNAAVVAVLSDTGVIKSGYPARVYADFCSVPPEDI